MHILISYICNFFVVLNHSQIAAMDGDAFAQELDRRYLSMVKNVNGYRWAKESGALEALASMTGASA